MTRWPWVSREAYEVVKAHNAQLEAMAQKILDHAFRIDRVEQGLPELAPQPRKQVEPMPKDLVAYAQQPGSLLHRQKLDQSLRAARLKLGSWDAVRESLPDLNEEEDE